MYFLIFFGIEGICIVIVFFYFVGVLSVVMVFFEFNIDIFICSKVCGG